MLQRMVISCNPAINPLQALWSIQCFIFVTINHVSLDSLLITLKYNNSYLKVMLINGYKIERFCFCRHLQGTNFSNLVKKSIAYSNLLVQLNTSNLHKLLSFKTRNLKVYFSLRLTHLKLYAVHESNGSWSTSLQWSRLIM